MEKLYIQIDDLVREMTDDEYAAYLEQQESAPTIPAVSNE